MAKKTNFSFDNSLPQVEASQVESFKKGVSDTTVRPIKKEVKAKIQRSVKGLRIRSDLQKDFDRLVFEQKQAGGKSGPELADEAIELILKAYS